LETAGLTMMAREQEEAEALAATLRDQALKHTLVFGIGIHHAGLDDRDRVTVGPAGQLVPRDKD
jgi:replicative superfamily II helicase